MVSEIIRDLRSYEHPKSTSKYLLDIFLGVLTICLAQLAIFSSFLGKTHLQLLQKASSLNFSWKIDGFENPPFKSNGFGRTRRTRNDEATG